MDSEVIFLYTGPMIKILLFLTLFISSLSFAKEYPYNELMTKDYDEMQASVRKGVLQAKKAAREKQKEGDEDGADQEAISLLRDTVQFILSRPDKDFMVSKLMPLVRKELVNYGAFEVSLETVATQAIMTLKSDKAATTTKSTAVFILENLMSEIKPEIELKPEFKKIVEQIRDAKIKIPDAVAADRKMTSMFKTISPSDTAKDILEKMKTMPKKRDSSKRAEKTLKDQED